MQTFLIYPLYTDLLAITAILLVPIQEIRKLLIYGLIFGALIDAILIFVCFLANYINYGPFGFMDIPFLGIFHWNLRRVYVPIILFCLWHIISTWGYLKLKKYKGTEEV